MTATGMPSFMTISDSNAFIISPTIADTLPSYLITVVINDGLYTASSTFTVFLLDDPPVFDSLPLIDQTISIGDPPKSYTILASDPNMIPFNMMV